MHLFKSLSKISIVILASLFFTSTLVSQVEGRKEAEIRQENNLSPHGQIETQWYKLGWFVDANIGTRLLGATSTDVKLSAGINTNFSLGYFFSDRFGIKGRYDFNSFKFTPGFNGQDVSTGRMHSASLEVLTDLIPLIKGTKIRDWRFIIHGGLGLSTYRNVDFKKYREEEIEPWSDPAIKGNDDMGHVILGVTPQYHINGRWSINLDVSSFLLIKQSRTFDHFSKEIFSGIGNVTTASLGLSLRL